MKDNHNSNAPKRQANGTLHRLAAFAETSGGGNPAGVWVGEALPSQQIMQQIAADVGYSETAFVAPTTGPERLIRYFSPLAEVPFCGHATIAAGSVLGQGGQSDDQVYRLSTIVGEVPLSVRVRNGRPEISLRSVLPAQKNVGDAVLKEALDTLGWTSDALDNAIPPMLAFAGAWHLVIAVRKMATLADLNYPFDRLKQLMLDHDLTTLQLVWRESETIFHARNPFPVGGVVEDPATGAAAAALGGYLRDQRLLPAPANLKIHQGEAMGRPSLLYVDVPANGGIVVRGHVEPILI